jgi:hypothetical protein
LIKIFSFSSTSTTSNDVYKELKYYMNMEQLSIIEDPLLWWKEKSSIHGVK